MTIWSKDILVETPFVLATVLLKMLKKKVTLGATLGLQKMTLLIIHTIEFRICVMGVLD